MVLVMRWQPKAFATDAMADHPEEKDKGAEEEEEERRICRFCLSDKVSATVTETLCCRASSCWLNPGPLHGKVLLQSLSGRFRKRKAKEDEEEEERRSEFLTPCLCSGTQAHVHRVCLTYWINQRISKGVPVARAYSCPVCLEKYRLPRNFWHETTLGSDRLGLRLIHNITSWYFSSCFLMGGISGVRATASTALQLAVSPLYLFPGLPMNVVMQVLESKPQAARTLAFAIAGVRLLPVYTKLALSASGFVLLKGWCLGGCVGSLMGGKRILRFSQRMLNRSLEQNNPA